MTKLSISILKSLASDVGAIAEAGRRARGISFDMAEKRQLVVDSLSDLADGDFVSTWTAFEGESARYRITAAGRSLLLPDPRLAAVLVATCAAFVIWATCDPAATRQTMRAATANPLGEVRPGLTEYQERCNAERDSWLVDLEERAS